MGRFTKTEKATFADRMRQNPTGSEALLFDRLRPWGFESQRNVLGWIVDLVHPGEMVIIEVDGASHRGREREDAARDWAMASAGYWVVRCSAGAVIEDVDRVARRILDEITDPFTDGILGWWGEYSLAAERGASRETARAIADARYPAVA